MSTEQNENNVCSKAKCFNQNAFYLAEEEALRDICEHCEHSGTDAKCKADVAKIITNYWSGKAKLEAQKALQGTSSTPYKCPVCDGAGVVRALLECLHMSRFQVLPAGRGRATHAMALVLFGRSYKQQIITIKMLFTFIITWFIILL